MGHVATQLASHADLLGALDPLGHHGHVGPMKGYNQADLFGRGDEGPGPTMPLVECCPRLSASKPLSRPGALDQGLVEEPQLILFEHPPEIVQEVQALGEGPADERSSDGQGHFQNG